MANDTTKNPFLLDTAGVTVLWNGRVNIDNIEFVNYAADTDTMVLQDRNGRTVWKANGASDLSTVRSGKVGWVDGLILNSITAGQVVIFIK